MARDEWYPTRVAWWRHPKVAALSLEAAGLWAKARSYIADNQLSGFVPRTALPTISAGKSTRKALSELTTGEHPLWVEIDTGWYLHDYEEHEGKLEQRRRTDRDRQQRHRDASRDVTPESRSQTKTKTKTKTKTLNANALRLENPVEVVPKVNFAATYVDAARSVNYDPLPEDIARVGKAAKQAFGAGKAERLIQAACERLGRENKGAALFSRVLADVERGKTVHGEASKDREIEGILQRWR